MIMSKNITLSHTRMIAGYQSPLLQTKQATYPQILVIRKEEVFIYYYFQMGSFSGGDFFRYPE
jgi:hypothetical protein